MTEDDGRRQEIKCIGHQVQVMENQSEGHEIMWKTRGG